jgi:hypothetical protein
MQHDNPITHAHRREFMRSTDPRATQSPKPRRLIRHVERRCAFVQNENACRAHERACGLETLRLSTRDERGVYTDRGVIAFWEGLDEAVDVRGAGGALDVHGGERRVPVRDGGVEVLRDDTAPILAYPQSKYNLLK